MECLLYDLIWIEREDWSGDAFEVETVQVHSADSRSFDFVDSGRYGFIAGTKLRWTLSYYDFRFLHVISERLKDSRVVREGRPFVNENMDWPNFENCREPDFRLLPPCNGTFIAEMSI